MAGMRSWKDQVKKSGPRTASRSREMYEAGLGIDIRPSNVTPYRGPSDQRTKALTARLMPCEDDGGRGQCQFRCKHLASRFQVRCSDANILPVQAWNIPVREASSTCMTCLHQTVLRNVWDLQAVHTLLMRSRNGGVAEATFQLPSYRPLALCHMRRSNRCFAVLRKSHA